MYRNSYIAYGLLAGGVLLSIGGGLHRIYCKKFISGFAQIGLYWLGILTLVLIIGFLFLFIWGIWILLDVFLTDDMVREINDENLQQKEEETNLLVKNLEKLYELYQSGAISEAEYNARKDIMLRK